MAKLRLIGAVGIKVRPDATGFRDEVKDQLRTLPKDAKVKIDVDIDMDPAQRAIEKARREEEKKTLNLRVGVEYDSIQAAKRQVESALRNLNTQDIPVKLDESSLQTALAKLKRLQSGAKVTMQINEDKAGYESALAKIRQIQRQKAEVPLTFKTDNKTLAAEAKKLEKLIADIPEPVKTITITHRNDRDSLNKALDQIDEALASLKEVKIEPKLTWTELMAQKKALTRELAKQPLVMKVQEDKEGYEAILKKITDLQKPKPVTFTYNTDPDSLAKAAAEVKSKLAAIARQQTISFKYDNNTSSLKQALAEVQAKIDENRKIELLATVDQRGLAEARAKIEGLLKNSEFQIKVDSSDLKDIEAQQKHLNELLDEYKVKDVTLHVKNNEDALRKAKDQLDDLVKERKAKVHAEAMTFEAAYQLAYASRARTVPFYVKVNTKSLAIAAGLIESLAGLNTLRETGEFLENLVTKFDTVALKAGSLLTVVGSLTDALVFMGTSLFPLGEGILNVTGLLATAPTMMAALTSSVLVTTMAWDGFKDAASGSDEALKKLPYSARKAALELRGTWESMQQPVQANYWNAMADSMEGFARETIPVLRAGLVSIADDMGSFTAGAINSLNKIAKNGDLQKMFGNLEGFFQNASKASEPFFDAFNKIGLKGSEFLPRFGQWLADISTRFDNWATKAANAGDINRWIEQGVTSLKQMWELGGGMIKMLEGITMAAKNAGHGGLGAVADEFDRIGTMMKGEPFQSRLSTIFDGAITGASALNVGVKDLGETLGKASVWVANLLSQLGKLGGDTLSNFAVTLRNLDFQSGLLKGLQGLDTMVQSLKVSFFNLGTIIGNLSTIAGAAFTGLGPVIDNIVNMLNIVVGTLTDNVVAIIPNLMGMMAGLISSLTGPVTLIANMLNGVLGFINSLPGPLASVATALMVFLTMSSKIGPMFEAKPGGLLEKIKYDFQQADGARAKFSGGLKNIGAGLLSAVGGPWGLAIGALTTGLAMAGQASQESKNRIDEYTASIDANTGALNANGLASAAKNLLDKDGFWEDRTRGAKKTQEAIELLGLSFQETATKAANGGQDYDDLMAKLDKFPGITGESGLSMHGFAEAMDISDEAAGKLSKGDIVHLKQRLQEVHTEAGTGADNFAKLNDGMSKVPADAAAKKVQDFNTAMRTYNDTTATADARTRALKTALDILNGKQLDLEDATAAVNNSMRSAAGEMQNVDGVMKKVGGTFYDANGKVKDFNGVINATSGEVSTVTSAGNDLRNSLKDTTTNVLQTATAMKDAHKPTQDIAKYLQEAKDQFVAMGVEAGLNKELVEKAWDHMIGANPKDIATTITAQGVEDAKNRVMNYQGQLEQVNAYRAVAKLEGDDWVLGEKLANSYTKLDEFNKTVATATADLNKDQADAKRNQMIIDLVALAGMNPTVFANMDPALFEEARKVVTKELEDLHKERPTPEVNAKIEDAENQLATINKKLEETGQKKPQPKVEPKTDDAIQKMRDVDAKMDETGGKRPKPIIDAETSGASNKLAGLNQQLDPFTGKTYSFTVIAKYTQSGKPVDLSGVDRQMADGAILDGYANGMRGFNPRLVSRLLSQVNVKAFANGGMEQHVAQIARPSSTYRVWAEPETGGEAYIPLAATKRNRSTAILREVASQFGYTLTKAQAFADGGVVSGGNSRNTGLQVHIDTFNQNANDTVEDVGRGIMRQVRNAGMAGIMDGI